MEKCKICSAKTISVIRNKPIRVGSFAKKEFTAEPIALYECAECNSIYLEKFCDVSFYADGEYRESFDNSKEINVNQFLHDEEINDVVHKIGLHNLRGKSVADFGAGGGNFLDAVSNFTKKTYAIEPAKHFHSYLSKNSDVFPLGEDFIRSDTKVDVATSLSVIEHLDDPVQHIRELLDSVVEGGTVYIKTPNYNDILSSFAGEDFFDYFIRISHSWYFNEQSMSYILKKANVKEFKISYFHKYNIGNLIGWLNEKKPTGNKNNIVFDDVFNAFYKKYIEQKGHGSHLWIEIKKSTKVQ